MDNLAKVVDAPSYVRDMDTGAVILQNREEVDKYQAAKRKRLEEVRKMMALQSEVESLRRDVDDLKQIIKSLKDHVKQ